MKSILILISSLFLFSACSEPQDTSPVPQAEKTEKTILALGDSLTAGYGLPVTDSYPSQLEAKLREKGYNYKLINAGIS
jgi:acyl-CoA thioesterase I